MPARHPKHTCHAEGCRRLVPPRLLFCARHWSRTPRALQLAIWREYKPYQERDKNPSLRYLAVQRAAVAAVAMLDSQLDAAAEARGQCDLLRTLCRERGLGDPLPGLEWSTLEL